MKNNNDRWTNTDAKWISKAGSTFQKNLYLEFAYRFDYNVSQPLSIDITAVSQYQFAINGQVVGRGPAPSNRTLYYFDHYDVEHLVAGTNLITVRLFHDGRLTETEQRFEYGDPGLLVRAYTDDAQIFVTDSTWRVRQSTIFSPLATMVSYWGGYKTIYHGEHEDGWQDPTYDHTGWETAVEVADPVSPDFVSALILRDVPDLETVPIGPEEIVAVSANRGEIQRNGARQSVPCPYVENITVEPGDSFAMPSLTVDFGRMVVGYPEIELSETGCIVEVWYGETLDMTRLDVAFLPAGGTWQCFQRRAFRFMKLNFIALEGPVTLKRITQYHTWYAYNAQADLTLPDDRLNTIIDISKYTVRVNSSYHYEDCPHREQGLWIFDMRSMSLVNYYHFYNPELTAKNLRQMFALQEPDGSIVSLGPRQSRLLMLDFCLHLIATLRDYYAHTGDQDLVNELFPYALKLDAYLRQFQTDDGLLDSDRVPGTHVFLDWSATIEKQGKTLILNALYARYLADMAVLAHLAGDHVQTATFEAAAAALKKQLHHTFFWEERGLYRDAWRKGEPLPTVSQQANMAAIYADIVPDDQIASVLEKSLSDFPSPFAPAFYLIIFEAMAKAGRYDLILETIQTYWGAMLDRGATTWWEVFDPTTPVWSYPHPFLGNTPTFEMDWIPISTCHGWSSVPAYAIVRHIIGIDLSHLFENRIIIRPNLTEQFGNIKYSLEIPGGLLAIETDDAGKLRIVDKPDQIEIIRCER